MNRPIVSLVLLIGTLSVSAASLAQETCTREDLQWVVNRYLLAQQQGDPTLLPLIRDARYIENMEDSKFSRSILQENMLIDFSRSLLDVEACETYTEVIVTDSRHPYVMGTRLKVAGRTISEFESIVTDDGDWLFNADDYLAYSPEEDWGTIAPAERDSRETLLAAANSYYDAFLTGDTSHVMWGTPCNRIEGGAMRTGEGSPEDSCDVGVPSGMDIHDRRFVVDPDIGAVAGLTRFGENNLPDAHVFRINHGKIRFVHTLTVCTIPNCGFELPPGIQDGAAADSSGAQSSD